MLAQRIATALVLLALLLPALWASSPWPFQGLFAINCHTEKCLCNASGIFRML
jgi:hypothetical protein